VTWGNGATGITGPVSRANSLVGSNPNDAVGLGTGVVGSGVTALANGNYVVDSTYWGGALCLEAGIGAQFLGAATWENGTAPAVGTVNAANSLVGTINAQLGTGNRVGLGGVIALTNGNYVVDSPDWGLGQPFTTPIPALGAVTWGNGTTGLIGTVSADNSLVGSFYGDDIGGRAAPDGSVTGYGGVTALANGNYVVDSPDLLKQTGAVTWANGANGISGTVSADNSLVGDLPGDYVGGGAVAGGNITALANGNYVVVSLTKGTTTWGNGTTGIKGTISSVNSLGLAGAAGINALPNGNYLVVNTPPGPLDEPVPQATWVDGSTGTTLDGQSTPDAQNSFMGHGGGVSIEPIASGNVFLFTAASDLNPTVGFTDPNLLSYALGQGQTINITPGFLTRSLDAGTDVTLQSNDDIIVDSPITENPTGTAGSLTLQAGRSILLNADINTAGGDLTLIANDTRADGVVDTERDPGDAVIAEQSGASINTAGGTFTVDLKDSTDKTNNGKGAVTLPQVNGTETLSSASTVGITINGTTPGDGVAAGSYTQLNVTGSIDLNSAALAVAYGASTAVGTTFTIVQTTAGVSGTFGGLSEGATVIASDGVQFRISYQGNGGNNVVLTQLTQAPVVPTQLVVTTQPPSAIAAGSRFGLVVKAEDDSGNVATSFTGSVTVALFDNPGGSTLGGMVHVTAVNGVATFSGLTLDQPGTGYTLQATGGGLTAATTTPFDVQPPVIPTQLVVTTQPPASVTAGSAFGFVVKAEDGSGNVASSFTGSVTIALANNPGGSTLGGTVTVPAINGVAFFSGLTLNQAGMGYTFQASSAGLASASTNPFSVTGSSRGIKAQLRTMTVRKRRKLIVEVLFADTGALKQTFLSPFQSPGFKNIHVTVRDSNGDGIPDEVVLTAKKGKRTVTKFIPA
jgi:hypothetical protein